MCIYISTERGRDWPPYNWWQNQYFIWAWRCFVLASCCLFFFCCVCWGVCVCCCFAWVGLGFIIFVLVWVCFFFCSPHPPSVFCFFLWAVLFVWLCSFVSLPCFFPSVLCYVLTFLPLPICLLDLGPCTGICCFHSSLQKASMFFSLRHCNPDYALFPTASKFNYGDLILTSWKYIWRTFFPLSVF